MVAKFKIEGVEKGRFYNLTKTVDGYKIEELGVTITPNSERLITVHKVMPRLLGYGVENGVIEIMTYISTHTHSEYSILDSINKVSDLAEKAVGAMALTDHGNMAGTLSFQKEMEHRGKKAIIGCEVYMERPATNGKRRGTYHLILLAKTQEGLKNLTRIVSLAFNNMFNGRGLVSWELLEQFHEGIICTSACVSGEIARKIADDDIDGARETVRKLKAIFGADFYIEIQHHGFALEEKVNPKLSMIAKEEGVKLIAGVDSHWLNKGQEEAHDIVLAINDTSMKKSTEPIMVSGNHRTFEGTNYHVLSNWEAFNLFKDEPEALLSTLEVAQKCNAGFVIGEYHNPTFDFIPDNFQGGVDDYFKHLIKKGYIERIINKGLHSEEYQKRLQYEVSVILHMGYAAYFLIVNKYTVYAKEHDIAVGPGRGSAAGSLVAYCLYITDIDPIKYGLLFERFLNPDRVSMPDIDMDFEYSKRQQVLEYVTKLFGRDRVANIVTFGQMKGRNAIRDVARVYGEQSLGTELVRYIPKGDPKATIKGSLKEDDDFKAFVDGHEDAQMLINRAMSVEGLNRNKSTHACGVVIAPQPLEELIPTFMVGNQKEGYNLATQFVCGEVEEVGLLKMDFLGLKTMGVLNETIKAILKTKGSLVGGATNYADIPINDPYVYRDIARGSAAIFQIESGGMQGLMKQLYSDVAGKISQFEKLPEEERKVKLSEYGEELFDRLIAGVAMYRPGPMDFIPDYIEGMNNPEGIKYDHELLEPILKNTYGVIVYQEQVMQIVQVLAGFTMAQADMVRKAMGKKKEALMAEYKEYFLHGSGDKVDSHTKQPMNIPGCEAMGVSVEVAEVIWDKMKDFAKYAFNKSHACAYAVLSARCAWEKYYYPTYYMATLLNVYINDDKFDIYLADAKAMGIEMLKPDINISENEFIVEGDNKVRFGLGGLKSLNKSVTDILEERKKEPFSSVYNCIYRTRINKATITSLIYSGAMDCFEGSRNSKIYMLDKWVKEATDEYKAEKKVMANQLSFDFIEKPGEVFSKTPMIPEMSQKEMLKREKEFSGLYISAHPLDSYSSEIKAFGVKTLAQLVEYDDEGNLLRISGGNVKLAGVVTGLKVIRTKKDNRPMAFFDIEDATGKIPVVLFPDSYANYHSSVIEEECICIIGKLQDKDGEAQLIADIVTLCDELKESLSVKTIYVKVNSKEEYKALENIVGAEKGETPVKFQYNGTLYNCKNKTLASARLFMSLEAKFGRNSVKYC